MGTGDKGVHGAQTEIRVDGQRIDPERGIVTEEGLGVGVVGGTDVPSFGIGDDQESCTPGLGDGPLQGPKPTPAVALIEGGLHLDQAHRPDGSFESDVGKVIQTVGRIPDPQSSSIRPEGSNPQASGPNLSRTAANREANESAMSPSLAHQGSAGGGSSVIGRP